MNNNTNIKNLLIYNYMTYDKSLKLLNYAQTDNNNLKLFTELDHSFKLGDRVYIVGGFYDNVSDINPNDPFSVNYYTVIDVDYNRNSFTIDYTIPSISDLTYPYTKKGGAVGWKSSDPFGTDAYNKYDDDEIYKHVYVSRCVFNAGIFNAGIINNGIFGTDDNTIDVSCHISNVNNTSIPTDNVKITHIVSKNIKITKGIVINKTVNVNIATRKFKVIENENISLTNNIQHNPFTIAQINVGQNNDGYGYTVLEGFKTIQTNSVSNILSIKDTKIDNYLTGGVILDNVTLDNCQLGSNNLINSQHTRIEYKNNIQINNSLIKNLKVGSSGGVVNFNIDNSTFNNGKKVTVLKDSNDDWIFDINFNGNSSTQEYSLRINYDSLANIGDMTGVPVYLSGITNSTKPNHEFFGYSVIQNITYNYGEYDNGVLLELELKDLEFEVTDTHLNDFDFSNIKIIELNTISRNIKNSTFNDFALESGSPLESRSLIYNSEIKNGYYEHIIYENTNCNADNGGVVVLNECQQILSNNIIESESNIVYNNCHITNQLVSGIITNTYLDKANLYESKLGSNVQVVGGSLNYVEFISNSNINIDLNIKYNNVKYNYNQDVVGIHENIYPEGRKSPLVIGSSTQDLPLSKDNYAQNFNIIKLGSVSQLPTSQFLIDTDNNTYKLIYETPHYGYVDSAYWSTNDVTYTIDPDKTISQTMTVGYESITNPTARNFFIKFDDDPTLYNTDRTNNNPSPTISPDFTGPSRTDTLNTPIDIDDYWYEIPENYLLEIDNYNYKELPRSFCYITTDFYDQSYTIDKFPDYDMNKSNLDGIIKLELFDTVNNNYVIIGNGDNVTISNPTEFNLLLDDFVDHNGVVLGSGSKIPSTFIEIEFIEIEDNSGTNRRIINQIPRYSGQSNNYDQYAINNIIDYQDFTNSIRISAQNIFDAKLNNNYDQESIPFQYIPNGAFNIKIQYWITWNFGAYIALGLDGENIAGGSAWMFSKRTRHTFEFSGI